MPHQTIPFLKMSGLGNEILVVDLRDKALDLTADGVRTASDRYAISFDQLMVLKPARTQGTAAFVDIWNRDGSSAATCGNGMRCIAALEFRRLDEDKVRFETKAGILEAYRAENNMVTVDMGRPKFDWADIPLKSAQANTQAIDLVYPKTGKPVLKNPAVVNVGNPHAIFWVDDIDAYDLEKIGPIIGQDELFPENINISLAQVGVPTHLVLKVWERGAGITQACGSAACAAAVAAARAGKTAREVSVRLPGGKLEIVWREDDHILMTGPWETEYQGALPWNLLSPISSQTSQPGE